MDSGKSRVGFDAFHPLGNFGGASETPSGEVELDIEDLKKPIKGSPDRAGRQPAHREGRAGTRTCAGRSTASAIRRSATGSTRSRARSTSLTENTDVLLTLHGVLSMRGTERPVSFMGRVRLRQGALWVRGENRLRPADFGVPPLRSWLVSMKEYVLATFDLILSKAN